MVRLIDENGVLCVECDSSLYIIYTHHPCDNYLFYLVLIMSLVSSFCVCVSVR